MLLNSCCVYPGPAVMAVVSAALTGRARAGWRPRAGFSPATLAISSFRRWASLRFCSRRRRISRREVVRCRLRRVSRRPVDPPREGSIVRRFESETIADFSASRLAGARSRSLRSEGHRFLRGDSAAVHRSRGNILVQKPCWASPRSSSSSSCFRPMSGRGRPASAASRRSRRCGRSGPAVSSCSGVGAAVARENV